MLRLVEIAIVALVAAVVLAPLGHEYVDLRRSWGLGRLAAAGTTLLVLPSVGVGFVLALPLAAHPPLQWTTTVLAALLTYSLAAARVRSAAHPAEARSHR